MKPNFVKLLAWVLFSAVSTAHAVIIEFRTFSFSDSKPIADYNTAQVTFSSPTDLVAELARESFNFIEGLNLGDQPGKFSAPFAGLATSISLETYDRDTRSATNILREIVVPSVFKADYLDIAGVSVGSDTFIMDDLLESFQGDNATPFSSVVISWQTGSGLFDRNEDPHCGGGPGCPPPNIVSPSCISDTHHSWQVAASEAGHAPADYE